MTGIAAELMRAAPVLAAVAAVAAIFPRRAVGFAAADPRPAEPSAAFVLRRFVFVQHCVPTCTVSYSLPSASTIFDVPQVKEAEPEAVVVNATSLP